MAVQLPAVHMNGNNEAGFMEDLERAFHAVNDAIKAVEGTSHSLVHMRNYYVLPDGQAAFERARDQHYNRLERLTMVKAELEELMIGIQEGGAR